MITTLILLNKTWPSSGSVTSVCSCRKQKNKGVKTVRKITTNKNKKERNHKRSRRLAREIMIVRTKQRLTDLKLAKMASPKALVMCLAKIAPTLILSLLDATLSSSCLIMHAIRCL